MNSTRWDHKTAKLANKKNMKCQFIFLFACIISIIPNYEAIVVVSGKELQIIIFGIGKFFIFEPFEQQLHHLPYIIITRFFRVFQMGPLLRL